MWDRYRLAFDHVRIRRFLSRAKFLIIHLHQIHVHIITTSLPPSQDGPNSSSSQFPTSILHAVAALPSAARTDKRTLMYAESVFRHAIPNPSTMCFNLIIRIHVLFSHPFRALQLFLDMQRLGLRPNFHSIPSVLKACAGLGFFRVADSLHGACYKFGFLSCLFVTNSLIHVYCVSKTLDRACKVLNASTVKDVVSYNTLIDGFVKVGDIRGARQVFDEMPERDHVSWGSIVSGYVQAGCSREGIELLGFMIRACIRPESVVLVAVLSACSRLGDVESGKKIHSYIQSNRVKVDAFLVTALVDLYAKCGYIDIAMAIFKRYYSECNLYTWNAILLGLAMHGCSRLLSSCFSRMIGDGVKPDGVTMLAFLVGCSHGGHVEEARRVFDKMESFYGVPRELKHYGCMADLLARAGRIDEAIAMIQEMPMQGDMFVWSGLLGGCRTHGDIETAEAAARHVVALKPDDGGVYSVMADVYASAERWEDVVHVRRTLSRNKVVKKKAACSAISLDGVLHEFLSGHSSHPLCLEIYSIANALHVHQCDAG